MNKCREAFEIANSGKNLTRNPTYDCYADPDLWKPWRDWQAAWNARGKVDAEICRKAWHDDSIELANTIEQEQCE